MHLLHFYNELNDNEKKELLNEIECIDFDLIKKLYNQIKEPIKELNGKIDPMPYLVESDLSDEDKEKYRKIGVDIIKNGQLAVVTMAGGQGTRLRT